MKPTVVLVIFEGGSTVSPLEKVFRQVRRGVVLDLIEKARKAGITRTVLCTPYRDLVEPGTALGAEVELEEETANFHFGRRLAEVVGKGAMDKVLYMGGASAPLISWQELKFLTDILETNENVVIANNYHSADIVGFSPGAALQKVVLPPIDNSLALALVHDAKLRFVELQRTLGLNFDLDTPSDLLILASHPDVGDYTRASFRGLRIDSTRCDEIQRVVADPLGEIVVFGRVNANLFQFMDAQTRCRVRLYSEERGMKSLGRDVRQEVISLIGQFIQTVGSEEFFRFLGKICDAALLDSRVLFEHFHWNLNQADRFNSDWGLVDQITHSGLKEFTAAALAAPIPVLLGGHSMVTGGLWALIDAVSRKC